MTLLFASTFTDALSRLSAAEQKQAKLTAFDLQVDPRGNGLQMHRIQKAPGFWSVRVNRDLRLILHRQGEDSLIAYVGHHDDAYRWAERRRLVVHERTGAMQFVPVVDALQETASGQIMDAGAAPGLSLLQAAREVADEREAGQRVVNLAPIRPRPFADLSDDALLDVGVPRDWLEIVRRTEETDASELFDLLPGEAAEALLDFLTGGRLEDHIAPVARPGDDPFAHPDALRRFRVVDNIEELQAALDQPFEKWAVFLHPAQRALVERDWKGPARVTGSAGTGKTIVALHRAVHIARRDPAARVLLTTFSRPLAAALNAKCQILTEAEPHLRERITVQTLDQAADALFTRLDGQPNHATAAQVRVAIAEARKAGLGVGLGEAFLFEEWSEVVDAWGLADAASYASVPRIGRRTRLGPNQREAAWSVFAFVRDWLARRKRVTRAAIYGRLTAWLDDGGVLGFSHVVVDEAQDLSVAQVRFLGRVAKLRGDGLFLAGDIGQRIFHLPFSWARLGLDVRGRSHGLKVNYRTSHQIRRSADRLLPSAIVDMDGIEEGRRGTVSVFDGPEPVVTLHPDEMAERNRVCAWLAERLAEGMAAREIAVLVRGEGQLGRARAALRQAGLDPREADGVAVCTMHAAKGLEFRAVCVMACDEDVLPDPARLAGIGDVADLEAAFETERHLLYVACTRARDRLLVSGVEPGSEFLDDLATGRAE